MSENFSVAISYGENLGYVEFDEATKKVIVVIADEVAKRKAEEFLSQVHEIKIPHETLLDFTSEKIDPQADAESLKIVNCFDAPLGKYGRTRRLESSR